MTTFIKSAFAIVLCLLSCIAVKAQPGYWKRLHPNVVLYEGSPVDTTKETLTPKMRIYVNRMASIAQLGHEHFLLNNMGPQNLGVRFNKKSELYEGLGDGNATSVLLKGKSDVEFIAQDVNPQNAKNYLYRVIQNNERELRSWTQPTQFETIADDKYTYACLGKFAYQPQQVLKIEIYNITNFKEQDAIVIDWRKVIAAKVSATADYLSYHSPMPDNGLLSRGFYPMDKMVMLMKNGKQVPLFPPAQNFIQSTSNQDLRIRLADSLQKITFFINNKPIIINFR